MKFFFLRNDIVKFKEEKYLPDFIRIFIIMLVFCFGYFHFHYQFPYWFLWIIDSYWASMLKYIKFSKKQTFLYANVYVPVGKKCSFSKIKRAFF